jgi:low temperature requirement protein LtrA
VKQRRPIFEAPRLRGDADEELRTTWLEPFFDLVFVGAVDSVARVLLGPITGDVIFRYLVLVVPVWWAWVGYAIYANRFGTDDLSDRLLTLVQMCAITVLAARAHDALEEGAPIFAASYGASGIILALRYTLVAQHVPQARAFAVRHAIGFGLAGLLWIVSAAVPSPARFALWGAGFLVDVIATPFSVRRLTATVPPRASHLQERFGLFTLILLGEGVYNVVAALRHFTWVPIAVGGAGLAYLLGFALWWAYFETLDAAAIEAVSRGRADAYRLWVSAHLPLTVGMTAAAAGLGNAILSAPRAAVPNLQRWLLCGAIALCFIAFALIDLAAAMAVGRRLVRPAMLARAIPATAAVAVGAFGSGLEWVGVVGLLALAGCIYIAADLWQRTRRLPMAV